MTFANVHGAAGNLRAITRLQRPEVRVGAYIGGVMVLAGIFFFVGIGRADALIGAVAAMLVVLALLALWLRTAHARRSRAEQLLALLEQIAPASEPGCASASPMAGSSCQGTGEWLDRLEQAIRSTARAYRSLEVEREGAKALVEKHTTERATFFARLSHELRTPLNAILGYASLLEEQVDAELNPQLFADVVCIRTAGKDLLSLIDNLLDIAQDRRHRPNTDRMPFTMGEVYSELAANRLPPGSDCRLVIEPITDNQTYFGSSEKVVRAIASLIDDAVRRQDAACVQVSSPVAVAHADAVEVSIDIDRKAGAIRANQQDEIGRAVNDGLARSVGGTISFEEIDGGRARYLLRLPLDIKMNETPDMNSNPVTEASAAVDAPKRGKTALVIDDDPAAIDLLGRWLKRCGYVVLSAPNAKIGLDIAGREHLDIVLLDALMPGRTGYDVLPALRALPSMESTPVLIVTVDDDRSRGLEAGASDVIRKPVTESELRDLISVYETTQSGDVLIIDDDEAAAEILDRTVRRLGFTTRRARDGEQGLALVREKAPGAILLDLNMPNLNGFEFIDQLAAEGDLASIPLIVVSGQDLSVVQHHKLVSAGCRFYQKGSAAPREIAEGLREAIA